MLLATKSKTTCHGILLLFGLLPGLMATVAAGLDAVCPYEPASEMRTNSWPTPAAVNLQGSFVSTDQRVERDCLFDSRTNSTQIGKVRAWRGERVNAQIVLSSPSGCKQLRIISKPDRGLADHLQTRFVRYTRGEGGKLSGDILDTAQRLDLAPGTSRPMWITVDVPRNTAPGLCQIPLCAMAESGARLDFVLNLEILPTTLPLPHDWSFHLDLWQNPYAVARYHHVAPWSPEHFALLTPHMKMLAEAGQKVLTASILYQPWGTQTYDPYDSMIEWIHCRDGSWRFDYSVFDRWVDFGARCGIDRQINCYSLIPWSNRFRYLDETSGDYRTVEALPGTPAYEEHLRPFLRDFQRHLKSKGWLAKTCVAMDERPMPVMRKLLDFLHREAPGLQVASAANYSAELSENIADLSVELSHSQQLPPLALRQRALSGRHTTFYVCCNPNWPNTFTHSPPAEAEWLPLYAAAHSFGGFLRWAYDSWVAEPLQDTAHVTWTAGDCFLVYPGARSSVRFERLRAGIQDFEKIRLLRAAGAKSSASAEFREAVKQLDAALSKLQFDGDQRGDFESEVRRVRAAIDSASRLMNPL